MCGRASCTIPIYGSNTSSSGTTSNNSNVANNDKQESIQSIANIKFITNLDYVSKSFRPSKNLSPNTMFPVIYNNNHKNKDITIMNWGLHSSHVNVPLINAKIETIEETIFKSLLKTNRCCVVIDGFYEFKKVMKDDKVLVLILILILILILY